MYTRCILKQKVIAYASSDEGQKLIETIMRVSGTVQRVSKASRR